MSRLSLEMDPATLRRITGLTEDQLPDDPTDEQVESALATYTAPAPDGQTFTPPAGTILVDEKTWESVNAQSARLENRVTAQDRDRVIGDAIAAGKIAPARRLHFERAWDADPKGTKAVIAALAPDVIPVEARGSGRTDEEAALAGGESYPGQWLPEVAAAQGAGPQRQTTWMID